VVANLFLPSGLAQDPEPRGQAFNFSNEIQAHGVVMVERLLALMGSELGADACVTRRRTRIPHQYLERGEGEANFDWSPLFTLDEACDIRSTGTKLSRSGLTSIAISYRTRRTAAR